MITDRIEKKVLLRAPLQRVWRALSDSQEFGTWFGVKFDGPFVPGVCLRGVVTPTKVDAEVAKAQKQYEGAPFEITVEQMDAGRHPLSGGIHLRLIRASTIRRNRPRW